MEELISVIVPIYNVEKYLDRCIQSLVNQTYQNLEIILVDDGSPDRCPQMCDEWAKHDNRIKVIHKQNGGLSAARNAGIKVAQGQYIGFIDSDDYVALTMFEVLYKAIKTEHAEIAICNFELVTDNGETIEGQSPIINEAFSGKIGVEKLLENGGWYYVTAWNKLYSRTVVEEMEFPEGRIHEDEFFVHEVFWKCRKIVTIEEKLYKYVQREGSIMSSTKGVKSLDKVEAFCARVLFYKEKGIEHCALKLLPVLKHTYIQQRISISGRVSRSDRLRIREIDKLYYRTYFSCKKKASIKERVIFYFPTVMCLYHRR